MTARLWDRSTDTVVSAELLLEMTSEQLVETERAWRRFRREARERARLEGKEIPEHNHWNWERKSRELRWTAYRCLGLRHSAAIQGLMMISMLAASGRSTAHKTKPVLYIKYIESTPWNLRAG